MIELWLIYKDMDGGEKRTVVDTPRFAIGRHSENELSITDSRLSRQHLLIESRADEFFVSDLGSSNGTELNGAKLSDATLLKSGDSLSLGGLIIEIEIVAPEPEAASNAAPDAAEPAPEQPTNPPQAAPTAAVSHDDNGFPKSFFIIAPIFALVILTGVAILVFLSAGRSNPTDNTNFIYSGDPDDPPKNRKEKNTSVPGGSNEASNVLPSNVILPVNTGNGNADPTSTSNLGDTGKTEQNAASFLRRAAQNDGKAFITGQQAKIVDAQIKSLSSSSALAENINAGKRNAAQLKAIAASKNLKPQLLAIAAITKLGNSKGDVLQAAQSMAEVLGRLGTQIGSELGDDCLLMMSAYDQGAAGDFMKMRNMLQDVASKSQESSRAIRTIWFLKQNGKISDEQYNFAVRFLAIGAISQNPKDYGVNAEALAL